MIRNLILLPCIVVILCSAPLSFAAGGGGGGGSLPSASAPRYDAAKEYKKGISALEAANYKAAIKAFRRVLTVTRKDANTNYLLGFSYMQQKNFKKAARSFKKAIKYNKSMILARRDLAITLVMLEKKDKAQAELDTLNALLQNCNDNQCQEKNKIVEAIGIVEQAINNQKSAAANLKQIINFVSTHQTDNIYLNAVGLINQKQYKQAITELSQTMLSAGPHPDILTYLGFANRKLKRFTIAEQYYLQALAVAPNHLGANEYYGELMLEKGNISGARRKLAKLDSLCKFGCYEAEELRRWIQISEQSHS